MVSAGEDFFPEVKDIYDNYLKALTTICDVPNYQLKIDDKLEFDGESGKTASYLAKQWRDNKNKSDNLFTIITSSHSEMTEAIS